MLQWHVLSIFEDNPLKKVVQFVVANSESIAGSFVDYEEIEDVLSVFETIFDSWDLNILDS